ncbi:hypothetical protein [Paenibacillus segetis]|uniref:hypothetical protein n=1 Tax=Paenibacillus segetis TaxID=1325360 RepID=UPI00166A6F51|nr:hypothetical protein [Paenibacillus segetis]
MSTTRKGTVGFIIIVAFLSIFMVLSYPGSSGSLGFSESTDREIYESDYSHRSPKVLLRVKTAYHNHFIMDRTPFHNLLVSAVAFLLLAAPSVHFRPFHSLFMKRTLLLPIKFTSKFVT